MKKKLSVVVPADVPDNVKQTFIDNYCAITKNTENLFVFACDHKIEHLNNDFYGADIDLDAMHPEHIFKIAAHGTIGALATHGGLIARYGLHYPSVNYIVKLNGKTNVIPDTISDPRSANLYSVEDVITLQKTSGLALRGIGITLYLGSMYEQEMLEKTAQAVNQAHKHGMIALIWIYLRGTVITDDHSTELTAGAAGLGTSLGADFIKIKAVEHVESLRIASVAAGNTKIIAAGGSMKPFRYVCEKLYAQIHKGGIAGGAFGRIIFQCSQTEAIARTHAIAALIYEQATVDMALTLYHQKLTQ